MPPTSKKMEGHIASGTFIRSSRFLMHCRTLELCMLLFLKFLTWIPHKKGRYVFFSRQDYAPFLSYGPLKKIWMKSCQQNLSKTIKARALKLEE